METGADGVDVLPAASVLVAVNVCAPPPSGVVGVNVHWPVPSAVAVPMATPSTRTVTVLLGSAVPAMVGVVDVLSPFAGPVMMGAVGAVVSMMKVLVFDTIDVLPAASAAVALTEWLPSASGVVGVKVHAPEASAVTVPTALPSTRRVTVEPASAVPEYVGVVSLVVLPLAGAVTTGAAGATVSTVMFTGLLGGVVPFALVAVAVMTCGPLLRSADGVHEKAPVPLDVVVQTGTPSTNTVTVTLGLVVPVTVGRGSLVVVPLAGAVRVGVSASGPKVTTTV
jgi:hypothetical protein